MFSRRKFLTKTTLGSLSVAIGSSCTSQDTSEENNLNKKLIPTVVATWQPNIKATKVAWDIIEKGGKAIDAVEQGVRIPEADPEDRSVGYGGRPDREGNVTLDACIMDENGNCGSVCFLQNIKHPISVKRI